MGDFLGGLAGGVGAPKAIVVALEGGPAVKADERKLQRAKGRTQRLRDRAASKLGIPRSQKAAGAAAGFRMVSRFRRVGVNNVDPWSEAAVSLTAFERQLVNEKLGFSSRAQRAAREEAANTYGAVTDETARRSLALRYYNDVYELHNSQDKGLLIMQQEIVGPSLAEIAARTLKGYAQLIKEAHDWMMGEIEKGI